MSTMSDGLSKPFNGYITSQEQKKIPVPEKESVCCMTAYDTIIAWVREGQPHVSVGESHEAP